MEQLDKAEDAFRKSILISDEVCPPAAGAFRASLALLLAQQDKIDEAQVLFKTGEPLVASYPIELTKFLCKRGQVHLLADEPEAAQKSLDQAIAIATEHKIQTNVALTQRFSALKALLDSPDEPTGEGREDALIEAERLMELGNIEKAESKFSEAERCYQSARDLFQKHGNRAGEGEAIGGLGNTYHDRGEMDRAHSHYTQAIDIAREVGDKRIVGTHLGNLGNIYEQKGELDRAVKFYTQAIDIAREIGNKVSEGANLGNLGIVYINKGEMDRAVEYIIKAIDIAREIGDKRREGICLGSLGLIYQQKGEMDRAIEYIIKAIDIAREIGHKRGEGAHLGNLGDILFKQNRFEEAEDAFRKAIRIGEKAFPLAAGAFRASLALLLAQQGQREEAKDLLKIGEPLVAPYPVEHAKFLCKKGQIQFLAGEPKAAQESLDQVKARATEQKFGDDAEVKQAISDLEALLASPDSPDEPTGEDRAFELLEAERLMELGNIEEAEGKNPEAEQCYRSAIKLFQKHGDRLREGEAVGNLGIIHLKKSPTDRAKALFYQALAIAQEVNSKPSEAIMYGNLGNAYTKSGDLDRAVLLYTQAIDIAREIGNKRCEGVNLGNLGNAYSEMGELDLAIKNYTQSIEISRKLGSKRSEGLCLGNLGVLYKNKGELDRAIASYTQALEIARAVGDKLGTGINLGNIGDLLVQKNQFEMAERNFRQAIPIGDETFPLAAGAFRASLALLLAQQGQHDEAQELLKTGEPQVSGNPLEFIKFLSKKSHALLLADAPEAAQNFLDQAKALTIKHKLQNNDEIDQTFSALEALIEKAKDA
jgi:tetratricopeptide (TPR) repeat protein